jgi:hypothetical protein
VLTNAQLLHRIKEEFNGTSYKEAGLARESCLPVPET